MKSAKILVVDDNQSVLSALELLLMEKCRKIKTLVSPNLLLSELSADKYDLLLLDMNFTAGINSGNEGIYWLQRVLEINPEIGIIMITAYGDITLAVKAIKMGAIDFVLKPWNNENLLEIVQSAYRFCNSRKEAKKKIVENKNFEKLIIGTSEVWNKVMETAAKVATTDANILITGENGTGKELVAEQIHDLSLRSQNKMVRVDMGSIVPTLFESELFGHKKGSFTDARSDRIGKIEEATRSTLFLDEIGNMPVSLQSKLLSVLQSRTVTRVGENNPIPVDIRLICATNCNLPKMVETGTFRDDLYYRINTICIELPPLRNRKEDIPILANYFLQKYCEKYQKKELKISDFAMQKLSNHFWHGNVRELQNAIEKAVILCVNKTIDASDFIFHAGAIASSENYSGTLEEMERKLISDAMVKHKGNHSLMATQLGISRQTLYNKLKKYGL
ncbi:MAG: sigma-54 dependent transcriptional regulator [Marinilabiliaceae bacterium]|nr:sigma-54 dependent transcriptional regulator [Marinilabiliaceae bacterium]